MSSFNLKPKESKKPEFIAFKISADKRLFCNVCNTELLSDHSCGKCGIYYTPDKARHETVIRGLDGREPGPQPHTIPIAFVDTPKKKEEKMAPVFEGLKAKGFKWTSYTETNVK